jgi:hypothetical protein
MNVRSLCNKTFQTAAFILTNNIKLLFLTETWMHDDNDIDDAIVSETCPTDYKFLNSPRGHGKRGGGLALIYHKSITAISVLSPVLFQSFELTIFSYNYFKSKYFCLPYL